MPVHPEALPAHLETLVPSQWAVWRWFVLRVAGFPAQFIDRLVQPVCASAADEIVWAEQTLEERFQTSIRECNSALDQMTSNGIQREDEDFKALLRARR